MLACLPKQILSWVSRKLTWVSGILDEAYKTDLFLGESSRSLASHTD